MKPILFSTPMVQAILEGRKTQTRRIVKYKKKIQDPIVGFTAFTGDREFSVRGKHENGQFGESFFSLKICTGDILWVRETWKPGAWRDDGRVAFDYKASPELTNTPWVYPDNFNMYFEKWNAELLKNGSVPDQDGYHHWEAGKSPLKWKPSIFMPKEACRLFLQITNVRVERLQDITEDDALEEGIEVHSTPLADTGDYSCYPKNYLITEKEADGWPYFGEEEYVESFKSLWQKIHGIDSWDENPWVWVYEFKVIEKPNNNETNV